MSVAFDDTILIQLFAETAGIAAVTNSPKGNTAIHGLLF